MDNNKYLKLLSDYDVHAQHIYKMTVVDVAETAPEKERRIKQQEKTYIGWFEYYFPHYAKKKSARFHAQLAKLVIENNKIRLLAEMYRSSGKSVHIDMGLPLYLYVTRELHFMLLIGETEPKAKKLLSGIQAELEYNQRFINDYGRKMKKGDWSDGDFYTTDGIRFTAIGFGMSPRGLREGANRPDYIVVDDVDTKKHVNNDRMMSDSVDFITEEIEGCFDSDSDSTAIERLIYSNNNFHKNSITNRLKIQYKKNIKQDKEDGEKSDYHVFTVCAVKDLVSFEPTWPEKTTNEYWRKKYRRNTKSFLREYMHTHVSEGKIFKAEYFQWRTASKLSDYDALVIYGDLSYKDQADYKAMILMGKKGREFDFIHVLCRQTSRHGVAVWLYDLWEQKKLSEQNLKIKIEGLFAQDEFVSDFDAEGDERGYHIPVIADKRGKANKYDRIESTESFFERRWIFFNDKEKENTDQITLIDQYLAFEKGSGVNDDGPDCGHGCIDELNRMLFVQKFTPRTTRRVMSNTRY